MIGSLLGNRYRILKLLGQGAMGQVYLAQHIHLGRKEAVKVLLPDVASDERFISRFRREARATNRLQHPNIVSVYDFGQLEDGRFYLAMEYADGDSLDKILHREGPLPVTRVLRVISQLALAVDHAHSRGVVHRDLKPSNLLLVEHRGQEDVLKVLDFGIAKIICPEVIEDGIQLTCAGQVFGTAEYMAPEHLRGQPTDSRSDIYAVGCITFELLTGQLPFAGDHLTLARAHMDIPAPAPSERYLDGGIPPQLDEIVQCCMRKDARERFQTGGQLFVALTGVPGFPIKKPGGAHSSRVGGPEASLDSSIEETKQAWAKVESSLATATASGSQIFGGSGADGGLVSAEDLLASEREALRDLGEGLLDHGVQDARITVCLAKLRALEDDRARVELEQATLAEREAKTEQVAREREGSLRFALGELKFDRQRADEELQADLEFQIETLERRLADILERAKNHLDEITEQGIDLAASHAQLEDELAVAYDELRRLVEEVLPRFEDNLDVAPMVDRYLSIRELQDSIGPSLE